MTCGRKPGIDTRAGWRHLFASMIRFAAYSYFSFFGFFAPRNTGGCTSA